MKKFKRFIIPTILLVLGLGVIGGVYVRSNTAEKVVEAQVVVEQKTQPVVISKPAPPPVPDAGGIIKLTNEYRATKGLAPLAENERLNQSACLKAQDMAAKNYWSHVSPDGVEPWYFFEQAGYAYSVAGENLAYGFGTEYEVIAAWKKSPSHEANLSGNYLEVGICVLANVDYQGYVNSPVVAHYGTR